MLSSFVISAVSRGPSLPQPIGRFTCLHSEVCVHIPSLPQSAVGMRLGGELSIFTVFSLKLLPGESICRTQLRVVVKNGSERKNKAVALLITVR